MRGKRTLLLSQQVGADLTVQDLLVDGLTAEAAALVDELIDSRLAVVLRALNGEELALAREWAGTRDSWAQAALELGLPVAFGERVRRKLKRLGRQCEERASAAVWTVAVES